MNNAKLQAQKNTLVKKQSLWTRATTCSTTRREIPRRDFSAKWGGSGDRGLQFDFTEQKIICFWGVLGYLEISYNSIRGLSKSTQMFLPFGITITYTDKNGKGG